MGVRLRLGNLPADHRRHAVLLPPAEMVLSFVIRDQGETSLMDWTWIFRYDTRNYR